MFATTRDALRFPAEQNYKLGSSPTSAKLRAGQAGQRRQRLGIAPGIRNLGTALPGRFVQARRKAKQSVSAKWWKTLRGFPRGGHPPYAVAAICRVDNAKLVHLDDQTTNGSKHRSTLFAFQSAIAQSHQPPRSAGRNAAERREQQGTDHDFC
jgi:hypothetical protein